MQQQQQLRSSNAGPRPNGCALLLPRWTQQQRLGRLHALQKSWGSSNAPSCLHCSGTYSRACCCCCHLDALLYLSQSWLLSWLHHLQARVLLLGVKQQQQIMHQLQVCSLHLPLQQQQQQVEEHLLLQGQQRLAAMPGR
jgi:hypothetical protein